MISLVPGPLPPWEEGPRDEVELWCALINKPFKVVRAGQLEEVGFLPRVGELDDVLSGDTISLGQRREEMAYGVTGDTHTRNLTGSGTERWYPASNNAPVASSR